jgi:hypothetical protein
MVVPLLFWTTAPGVVVVVVVAVGAVTAATFSPSALVNGITDMPSGTALLNRTFVFGSYAVKAGSGEVTSINLDSGVVAVNVPVPFEIATGPRAVTTPLSSTA